MFLHSLGVNKNIVKIYKHTPVQQLKKDSVHHTLESCWSCAETEGHYSKLVGSIPTGKTRFDAVGWHHGDLVVAITHVYFRENRRPV